MGGRVIVVDAVGNVLADSSGLVTPDTRNYADCARPEILSALALTCVDPVTGRVRPEVPKTPAPETTIRFSHTLDAELLAAAAPVLDQGEVFGAVRITQNVEGVNTAVRNVTLAIAAIGLVGLAAGMLVAFALANSLARPLTRLADSARRIGAGDLAAEPVMSAARRRSGLSVKPSTRWRAGSSAPSVHNGSSSPMLRTSCARR